MTARAGARKGVIAPIDWAECGTEANYKRHIRLGEKPCAACTAAMRRNKQDRKVKRNA